MIYASRLGILDLLVKQVPSGGRSPISTPTILMILLFCLVTGRQPLYAMPHFTSQLDGGIFGLNYDLKKYGELGDDRFARKLDILYEMDRSSLMTKMSISMYKLANIRLDQIYNDSTSIASSGKMDNDTKQGLSFKRGHNKDRRPEWKQIIFTLSTTADGNIPIHFKTYSGNVTDDQTHIESWSTLCEIKGSTDFMYVADSKLATNEQLSFIKDKGGKAISIMPRTWGEYTHFIDSIKAKLPKKAFLFSRKTKGKECRYYVYKVKQYTKQGFGLHWIYSTQKYEEEISFRKNQINKATEKLIAIQNRLKKQKPIPIDAIKKKGQRKFFNKQEVSLVVSDALKSTKMTGYFCWNIAEYYRKNGKIRFFRLRFSLNDKAIKQAESTDGIFPLISTNPELSAENVLTAYKYQPFIETKFNKVKNIHAVCSPLFKRTDRFEALLFVEWMGLAIESVIERDLRKVASIKGLPLHPEGRRTKSPTFSQLSFLFKDIVRYIKIDDDSGRFLGTEQSKLTSEQKEVLAALSISEEKFWNSEIKTNS
jgi:transposase